MKCKAGMTNFLTTDIYGITSADHSLGRSNVEVVSQLIAADVRVIQYREKHKYARFMYEECRVIREMTRAAGITFIINDHIDLAMLVGADGVHIGQDDLPPEAVRRLVGADMIIGLSTHSASQALEAVQCGVVDYIGVGPIFKTQTKQDVCNPVGLGYLEFVVKNINLPFVAIGGIKEHNIALVRSREAKIIALVTEIVGAQNIKTKIAAIRESAAR
jgi:thiamine-phosphate pyrophosphorylase